MWHAAIRNRSTFVTFHKTSTYTNPLEVRCSIGDTPSNRMSTIQLRGNEHFYHRCIGKNSPADCENCFGDLRMLFCEPFESFAHGLQLLSFVQQQCVGGGTGRILIRLGGGNFRWAALAQET